MASLKYPFFPKGVLWTLVEHGQYRDAPKSIVQDKINFDVGFGDAREHICTFSLFTSLIQSWPSFKNEM